MDLRGEPDGGFFNVDSTPVERSALLAAAYAHCHEEFGGDENLPLEVIKAARTDSPEDRWPRHVLELFQIAVGREVECPVLAAPLHEQAEELKLKIDTALPKPQTDPKAG